MIDGLNIRVLRSYRTCDVDARTIRAVSGHIEEMSGNVFAASSQAGQSELSRYNDHQRYDRQQTGCKERGCNHFDVIPD